MESKRVLAPDAVAVEILRDYILRVRFDTGEVRDFDAKAQLLPRKCYASLKNPAVFKTAHIENGTVTWTDALDLDPEWMYAESV